MADEAVGAVAQLLPSLYEFSLQVGSLATRFIYFQMLISLPFPFPRKLGLSRHRQRIILLLAEAESLAEHSALELLLGADESRRREYW